MLSRLSLSLSDSLLVNMSVVEEKIRSISNLLKLQGDLRFDFLVAESYSDPNILYAVIEVLLNLPNTYFRSNTEREKYQSISKFVKQYARKTRKERRICDVLSEIKKQKAVIFEILDFAHPRVNISWYHERHEFRHKRKKYFSPHNDFYICSKNALNLVNERVPARVKKRTIRDRLLELLEAHFHCNICLEVMLEVRMHFSSTFIVPLLSLFFLSI